MSDKSQQVHFTITQQTFFDLGSWLAEDQNYTQSQLARLQNEQSYLPLIDLANQYWLTGALANSLQQSPVWTLIPMPLQEYLIEMERLYSNRNKSIQEEVKSSCALLLSAEVKVVLLKGATTLFNGVAKPLSTRYMSDIDILVPENALQSSIQILTGSGYFVEEEDEELLITNQAHHHAPPLIRPDAVCYLELHRWALPLSSHPLLSTAEIWGNAIPLSLDKNLQTLQLHPTHQVILAITHSEISDSAHEDGHIDLRQLYNLKSLVHNFVGDINWQTIEQHFQRTSQSHVLHAMLFSAYKIFALITPITRYDDTRAIAHFDQGIKSFVITQGDNKKFSYLTQVIKGYRRQTIIDLYGKDGRYPILLGRLRHLRRHIQLTFTRRFLSRFIRRNFNRD